jgi:hypothetical protein
MSSIDMTPTPEGFGRIAETFADTILRDVKRGRIAADADLIAEIVKVSAMLARNGHDEILAGLVRGIALTGRYAQETMDRETAASKGGTL